MDEQLQARSAPNSLEAEQALLGAILIDSRCLTDVIGIVRPEDFYLKQNREIFEAIYTMFNFSQNIDPVTVLEKLRDMLQARKSETCVVSIAAGVTIATMTGILGEDIPLIRMMQNTPVAVGEGVLVYACAPSANEADAAALEASMAAAGKIEPLPEKLIDAATAVMGCGPAFAYMFAEALADGGVACGLPRAQAQTYAAQTLLGAAKMLLETGEHPGALKEAACSPGGSTIQGVRVLEENGLRGATIDAVIAAYQKTQGLG